MKLKNIFKPMKRDKPYEVQQGESGLFVPAGDEPIDSPNVQFRMPKSLYEKFIAVAGDQKAAWVRQAIAEKLERDSAALASLLPRGDAKGERASQKNS